MKFKSWVFILILIITFGGGPAFAKFDLFAGFKKAGSQIRSMLSRPQKPDAQSLTPETSTDNNDFISKVVTQINRDKRTTSGAAIFHDQLPTDSHTEIRSVFTEDSLVLEIHYDKFAVENPEYAFRDLAFLRYFIRGNYTLENMMEFSDTFTGGDVDFLHMKPESFAELLQNVHAGSPIAKARYKKMQLQLLKSLQIKSGYPEFDKASRYHAQLIEKTANELTKDEELARRFYSTQKKKLDLERVETGILDNYEAMDEKLNDLIIKNDRKGVADMIRAYLPWPIMEPVETKAWKIWLEAIENPDWTNTEIGFRGVDYRTDKIIRRMSLKGEIFGFMSSVLTKNQGSFTRRLRSLSTNREKNGDGKNMNLEFPLVPVRITQQMMAHAKDPVASSFISFSHDIDVAARFVGQDKVSTPKGAIEPVYTDYGGFLVVKIDKRRMIQNFLSIYTGEREILAPLIIFPDEVVGYLEGKYVFNDRFRNFLKVVSEDPQVKEAIENQHPDKAIFIKEGMKFLKKINSEVGKSCVGVL